jgi:hypothetical protein
MSLERNDQDLTLWLDQAARQRALTARLEAVLRLYISVGLLITTFGLGALAYSLLPVELTRLQIYAVLTAGVGGALAAMSASLLYVRRQRLQQELKQQEDVNYIYKFLRAWAEFETIGRAVLSEGQESKSRYNPHSLRSLISRLHQKERINSQDVALLEYALKVRNSIVHHGRPISAHIAGTYADLLVRINSKLAQKDWRMSSEQIEK